MWRILSLPRSNNELSWRVWRQLTQCRHHWTAWGCQNQLWWGGEKPARRNFMNIKKIFQNRFCCSSVNIFISIVGFFKYHAIHIFLSDQRFYRKSMRLQRWNLSEIWKNLSLLIWSVNIFFSATIFYQVQDAASFFSFDNSAKTRLSIHRRDVPLLPGAGAATTTLSTMSYYCCDNARISEINWVRLGCELWWDWSEVPVETTPHLGDLFGLYSNRSPSIKSNQDKKILSWILLCRSGVVSSSLGLHVIDLKVIYYSPSPPGSNMLNWVVSRFTPSPRVYETSETYLNAPTMSVFIVSPIGKDQILPALLHQHHVVVGGDVRVAVPQVIGDIWDLSRSHQDVRVSYQYQTRTLEVEKQRNITKTNGMAENVQPVVDVRQRCRQCER